MKAFGGEPKQRVPRGRRSSASAGSVLTLPRKKGPVGLCLCPSTKGCHTSLNQQPSPSQPGSLCLQSTSSSNSVSVCFKRIFCLHICTPSPFLKDGFKPRCLQERGQNEYIHRGIQKIQFEGKCNNF